MKLISKSSSVVLSGRTDTVTGPSFSLLLHCHQPLTEIFSKGMPVANYKSLSLFLKMDDN